MSQRLAEEKKAAEETKRFYNEEIADEDAVEEAEFTDPDTSDCEFLQDEAEEDDRESDVCSELDEQEAGEGEERTSGDIGEGGERTSGEIGEGVHGDVEEDEGYSAEDEGEECFSDHERMNLMSGHFTKNKKQRLLDSDDEREAEREEGGDRDSSEVKRSEDKPVSVSGERHRVNQRPVGGVCEGEEASMGPLALVEDSCGEPMRADREWSNLAPVLFSEDTTTNGSLPPAGTAGEREREREVRDNSKADSDDENEADTALSPAVPESDKDNSLENSLLWGPSLPPAQPWNDSSVASGSNDQPGGEVGVSQWAGLSQRFRETQNTSLDEETTQFLDANG